MATLLFRYETVRPEMSRAGEIRADEIFSILESLGYKCEIRGSLRGASGITHVFQIVARGDGTRIVIEVLSSGQEEQHIISAIRFRTKTYDCSPELAIIVIPIKASKELKELCDFYKFAMIESSEIGDIGKEFAEIIGELSSSNKLSLS